VNAAPGATDFIAQGARCYQADESVIVRPLARLRFPTKVDSSPLPATAREKVTFHDDREHAGCGVRFVILLFGVDAFRVRG
jgi:hypothetical protein